MRIIAGVARGRRLATPKGQKDIRPTPDRVREAVFSILGEDVVGARVLDLFAGTGAMGLEALSRGAAWVTFVDHGREALALINRNAALCGFQSLAVVRADPTRDLARLKRRGFAPLKEERLYDLVFLDPPYGQGLVAKTLTELAGAALLAPMATVVAEHGPADEKIPPPQTAGPLSRTDSRRYGDVRVTFFYRLFLKNS
ncbi:MAG: 16S rRNA (guanine(966)-N(2))-methyltransferase RsmD [Pseudomonadota bacterium]